MEFFMIQLRRIFVPKALATALVWSQVSVLVPVLVIVGTGAGFAQFSIGGDRGDRPGDSTRSDGTRGDRSRGGGMRGTGIGLGIDIGGAIIENAAEENAKKKAGAGTSAPSPKKRNRAARKDDTPPTANPKKKPADKPKTDEPPKTVTKDSDKKDDKKKTPDDPTDTPKPGTDPTDVAIDDCVVIIQYEDGQIPSKEQDPTSAQNEDIKASAELIKNAETGTVTKDGQHLEEVIKGFKAKGCCKRIQIFGHGTSGVQIGQLQLPYQIGDSDMLGGLPKGNMTHDAGVAWDTFAQTLKDALCKDPKGSKPPITPQVKINACHSAELDDRDEGSPIAKELSKSGIRTSGWTKVCDFNDGEKPVLPQGHDADSREKTFLPTLPAKK
jgi:hypothetical protein